MEGSVDVSVARGESMSIPVEEPLRRVRMSWEEFLELPEKPKAEWVDGEAVLYMTPPIWGHGTAQLELGAMLRQRFPDGHFAVEAFLVLPRNRVRLPDLMMVEEPPPDGWVRTPPLLVVEVLSPSTRSEDMIRKAADYARGGAGQYWIVDPELRTIDAWRLVEGEWEQLAHLDEKHPRAEVELAGVSVPLDIESILRR
jgi:Uma2 family endonuclease